MIGTHIPSAHLNNPITWIIQVSDSLNKTKQQLNYIVQVICSITLETSQDVQNSLHTFLIAIAFRE